MLPPVASGQPLDELTTRENRHTHTNRCKEREIKKSMTRGKKCTTRIECLKMAAAAGGVVLASSVACRFNRSHRSQAYARFGE